MATVLQKFTSFLHLIKSIGFTSSMDDYEKRRLGIFNQLNFFGLLTGIIIPIAGLFNNGYLPPLAWVVAAAPAFISLVVLVSNYYQRHLFAMIWYFILYPVITCMVYAGGIDVGIELFFILYGVLAVFFLQNLRTVLVTISFSVICYLLIFIIHPEYKYVLRNINFSFYFFNHFLSVFCIFLVMFLIKKENYGYRLQMQFNNNALSNINTAIEQQKIELAQKAYLLEEKTQQLTQLDTLKNRLFSIISHDLRTPIYSLRNLFGNVQQYDLPGDEIKLLVPDIINDLNYTTSLMENLLQWAKSQMQGDSINPQLIDIAIMVNEVQQLLRLQAENKQVYVNSKIDPSIYIYADKEMINLVLRNLISNAIKFTPNLGKVYVGASVKNDIVEIFVKDTGTGISNENIKHLFSNNYFTTNGTANESGTGLGLMLCKEFLAKNGGEIFVESEVGKGSKFTFTLPKA